MLNHWKICAGLLSLASSLTVPAAPLAPPPSTLHRGDFVCVHLHSGPVYHLRFSGFDEASLVGGSGVLSVHLPRGDIASVDHESAPRDSQSALNPSTTMLSLLGLSAASLGAARSFGAGHACNGSAPGC